MDPRKIQFLIAMQREIDKVESREGESSTRVERLKSRFYDVVEVAEITEYPTEVKTEPVTFHTNNRDEKIFTLLNKIKENKPKIDRKHDPRKVTKFLKLFKFDNPSGLKELVHSPDDPQKFDFREHLYSGLEHTFKVFKENFLPNKLSERVIDLFECLCKDGLHFWDKYNQHPLYNDDSVTKIIQSFKQHYRFDEERTEASILRELIKNIANKVSYFSIEDLKIKFSDKFGEIRFKPNDDFFDINSIFFADVEDFKNGLYTVFESLIKHTNMDGSVCYDKSEKLLFIETISVKIVEGYKHQLIICDVGTKTKKNPDKIIESLRGKIENEDNDNDKFLKGYATKFLSVCDWSIKGFFAGEPKELIIQPFVSIEKSILPIENNSCNGFTHIFTFYDV